MTENYFQNLNNKGIPFMQGREKGQKEEYINRELHIDDFGFIDDPENGEYAVLSFVEEPKKFFFGNSVCTQMLKKVEADDMAEELVEHAIVFSKRISKKNREYIGFEFVS